jgi:Tol biopolymer transport system component
VLAPTRDLMLCDISPNGSELLLSPFSNVDVPLYILPLPSGAPRRVGDVLTSCAWWSPDAEHIVYPQSNALYFARKDGSETRKVVTVDGIPGAGAWSPDGRVLRFTLSDPKTEAYSLWEIDSNGTSLRPLLPGWSLPSSECCGRWTPDGKYFVFRSRSKGANNLWAIREKAGVLRATGREPTQLTSGPMQMTSFVPSKDGKKLFAIGVARRGELVRYDTKSRQFSQYFPGVSAVHLALLAVRKNICRYPSGRRTDVRL